MQRSEPGRGSKNDNISQVNCFFVGIKTNKFCFFSDFFATFAEVTNQESNSDGKSFYSLLTDGDYEPRTSAFVHYDPQWGKNVNRYRNQFTRTLDYKLYQDDKFYNLNVDILEELPISFDSLNENEQVIFNNLNNEMKKHPKLILNN